MVQSTEFRVACFLPWRQSDPGSWTCRLHVPLHSPCWLYRVGAGKNWSGLGEEGCAAVQDPLLNAAQNALAPGGCGHHLQCDSRSRYNEQSTGGVQRLGTA